MKSKKGQMGAAGGLILLFITILVGAILLQGAAQNIDQVVNTNNVANRSMGVASNSTTVYYTDYQALSSVVIYNVTGNVIVPATNYTVTNNVVYNGALAASILPKATTAYSGYVWNVSFVGQPTAYADSAGRSMASMIIIFMALALAVIAIGYAIRSYKEE